MGPELYHYDQAALDEMFAEGQRRIDQLRDDLRDAGLHVNLNGRCPVCRSTWPCRVEGHRAAETRRNVLAARAQRQERVRGEGGFTLIEILVVICIVGILIAAVVAVAGGGPSSDRESCHAAGGQWFENRYDPTRSGCITGPPGG